MKVFKKIVCLLLIVVMCLTSAPLSGFVGMELSDFNEWFADKANATEGLDVTGQCGENVFYTYDSDTGELVIGGTGEMWNYDNTTSISPFHRQYIVNVIIEYGVTHIGNYAFYVCDLLENITMPNSITSIGDGAFTSCQNLAVVNIPESVKTIGSLAFNNCNRITSVAIPSSVISIGDGVFDLCDNLTSIEVDSNNSVYSSDDEGILYNKSYSKIIYYPVGKTNSSYIVPAGVTDIGKYAFRYCNNLVDITMGDDVINIDSGAFVDCINLTSIVLGSGVATIGDNAFVGCKKLTNVTMGNSVVSIGDNAFNGCENLTEIDIPPSVKTIGYFAFANCDGLTRIDIPASVSYMDGCPFVDCDSLMAIVVDENNENYSSDVFGVLYNKDFSSLIQYPNGSERTYCFIPDTVVNIAQRAFACSNNLTGVRLSDSLKYIGYNAFTGCKNLIDIDFDDNEFYIIEAAFNNCDSIESFIMPDNQSTIEMFTFNSCDNLKTITIGANVTSIAYQAFYDCNSLTDVYFKGTKAQWDEINIADGNDSLSKATIHFDYEDIKTETLYRYRTKQTLISSNAVEDGYECYGSGWSAEPTKTETVKYAKKWPSGSSATKGFKTSSDLYKNYSKPSVEETETTKTVLGDESNAKTVGYLYWHWCYSHSDTDDGPINCIIKDNIEGKIARYDAEGQPTGKYYITKNFHAFYTPSTLSFSSSAKAYKKSYSSKCKYTYWWSGLNYGKSGNIEVISNTLSTYEREYYHYKWSEWSEWSNIPVEETADVEVETMERELPLKEGKCGENVIYTLNYDGTLIISGEGPMYDYTFYDEDEAVIPPYMTLGYDENGHIACGDNTIKNVIIEDGVTTIGDYAFNACTSLESIEIADTVTSIGAVSFDYCTSLKNITIPSSVTVIEEEAFSESGLETIEIENGLQTIEQIAFVYCQSLKSVTLPESVTSIGDFAFILCDKLETLIINNKDCEIGLEILMTGELDEDGNIVEDENGDPIPTECPTVLKGHSGSTAEEYAKTWTSAGYPIKFEVIEHKFVKIKDSEATCTTGGYALLECSVCGYEMKYNPTQALGHDYTEKLIDDAHLVSKATYDSKAVYKYDCSRCESISSETFEYGEKLVKVSSVSIKASTTIQKGKTETLAATVNPSNATNKKVTWKSSNAKVATVDNNGKVTAVAKGTATITVTTEEGEKTDTCIVTVNVPVTGVSLNKTSVSVIKGKSCQLTATVKPSDASNKNVTWSSSNTGVASVNSSGKVTAKAIGSATITIKSKDGGKTATCKVTVTSGTISVSGVSLNKNSTSVFVGKSIILNATIKPKDATNKKMSWSSSNTAVATVDNSGNITGKAKGTATITVKTADGNKTAKCTITVKPYNENIKKTGKFTLGGKNYKQDVTFDANWLEESSYDYNHNLAKFCSLASLLMYKNTDDGNISTILTGLKNIGFATKGNGISYSVPKRKNTKQHNNSYIITKKDYVFEGENHTAVLVLLRGTNGNEWYGNFVPGKESETHYSFNNGKKYVLDALSSFINKNNLSNTNNLKLIITGHSRGAAVGNLLSADIVKNNKFTESKNVFTYTFATPNVTKLSERNDSTYSNIFNFVNPEDFVTKCMPSKWGYGRYGVTLTLPSKTNEEKNYKTYYNKMNAVYEKYTGESYTHYSFGEANVYNLVSVMTKKVKNIDDFYDKNLSVYGLLVMKPKNFFQNTLCHFVSETSTKAEKAEALGICGEIIFAQLMSHDLLVSDVYEAIINFFISNEVIGMIKDKISIDGILDGITSDVLCIDRCFTEAHCAETYASFVTSMNYNQAYTLAKGKYRKPHKNTVNCPVDIEVYDKDTDELVGRIVDNVVDKEVTSIVMYVDGDSKSFWLPSNGNYDVKLIGNDSGEMDYTVSVIDPDLGEVERINFLNVPVEEDFEYVGEFTEEDFSIDEYALTTELGETIEKTEKVVEEEFNTIDISVNVEGIGSVKGEGVYTSGDYITLEAVTDENNNFLGWYEEDTLVSEEANMAFVVQENKTFTAKFTNLYVEATGISLSDNAITLDDSDENSYAVLKATLIPANATDMVLEWSTSDETVATVNEFGIVRAVGCGVATITVSFADGKLTGVCTVTVKCNDHNISDETIEVDATCTQAGFGYNTCKLCGYVENFTIEKYEHIYTSEIIAASCASGGYTINRCISCDYSYISEQTEELPHNFGDWFEVTPATCETAGAELRNCSECEYSETQEISATGHNYSNGVCSSCGDDLTETCSCNCHAGGLKGLIFKIILFFQKIFKKNKVCLCGIYHY